MANRKRKSDTPAGPWPEQVGIVGLCVEICSPWQWEHGRLPYYVPLTEVATPEALLHMTFHSLGKAWCSQWLARMFIDAVCGNWGWCTLGGPVHPASPWPRQ